jgi:hypothetical protein
MDQIQRYSQMMRPMVQPPAPQQIDRVTPQRQISGGPVSDQFQRQISGGPVKDQFQRQISGGPVKDPMQPMVQPTPPQQQVEQAIPQIAGAPLDAMGQYQKMMRQQQQKMGQISGNPYSQQLGQEDRRMEAMRRMQQMNLGG